jgi:signal peptidase II
MTESVMSESRTAALDPADEARRKLTLYVGMVVGVIALDQVTKQIVVSNMRLYSPIPILGDFFRLTFIYNTGAAFGLHLGDLSRWIFLALAAVAVVVLFLMYRQTAWSDKLRLVAIASVTGGAIGNLIDRVRSSRGVVDFLDFGVGDVRWPVFNVADIAVTLGALALAASLWREEKKIEKELEAEA